MTISVSEREIPPETLTKLFASKSRSTVLRVFMPDPLRPYYQRQIESITGLPLRAIQRELSRFTELGLLYRKEEGNRAYYRVNLSFPFFHELRTMVLKVSDPVDQLRGHLALCEDVRLAFLVERERSLLVVSRGERVPEIHLPEEYRLEVISFENFRSRLQNDPSSLSSYLRNGKDLLGRRDDVAWYHIEQAGFTVTKWRGVA